jgi:hypothetical protein
MQVKEEKSRHKIKSSNQPNSTSNEAFSNLFASNRAQLNKAKTSKKSIFNSLKNIFSILSY